MSKIKILNVVHTMTFGGVESVIFNYCSHMDFSKFEFYIITMKAESNYDAIKKFEDIGFKFILVDNWEKNPLVLFEIIKKIRPYKFDIIHSHMSHTNFYFMIIGWLSNIKVRISHSHLSVDNEKGFTRVKHMLYKKLISVFSTDYFACGKEAAVNLYGNKEDVIIFNNAIDVKKYLFDSNKRKQERKTFNFGENEIILCTIGRFTEQKNQLFLLDIFSDLLKTNENIDYKLLMVGNGNLKDEIENKINKLDLKNKIVILSDRTDIPDILQSVDLFLLPSLYEGLPVVGVEAQTSGLKCLFSDTIDKQVSIVPENCIFLPINKGTGCWIESIKKNISYFRKNEKKLITDSGFNIEVEAKKLEKKYVELYNG